MKTFEMKKREALQKIRKNEDISGTNNQCARF